MSNSDNARSSGIWGEEGSTGKGFVPLWAKLLFVASVVVMMVGLVMPAFNGGTPERGPGSAFRIPAAAVSALTGDPDAEATLNKSDSSRIVKMSPTMFRVGFGFFVAFMVSYALRACLRIALVAVAFFFITGFGLQHEGLVDVKWTQMQERYARISTDLGDGAKKASERSSELMRYLPCAVSAGLGLVVGFVRRRA
jgi:uncharacterized membrane protein (Fun14 family)